MSTGHRLATLLACLLLADAATSAQAPLADVLDAPGRAHVDAFFTALASGDPDTFEGMARTHCPPGFLERRTPDRRAEMVRRLRADFGTMTLVRTRVAAQEVVLDITGTSGLNGRATLTLEDAPARRIDRFGIQVEAGGDRDDGAPLPTPAVSAATADADLLQALDGWLSTQSRAGAFSGVVLVARGAHTVFVRGYGDADQAAHVRNTPEVRFNIGSINDRAMPARILIVEDDGVVAETLEAYLRQAGHEVTRVRDGREGLAIAQVGAHALVILDLMIPGLA